LNCGRTITWDEQRRQFGRAIQTYNYTVEEAKRLMPRCSHCLAVAARTGWRERERRLLALLPRDML
jgi:hypothetical protein